MEKTIKALSDAFLIASAELPSTHPVLNRIIQALQQTNLKNTAQHISMLRREVAQNVVKQSKPTGRQNRHGRSLVRFSPGLGEVTHALIESTDRKPSARPIADKKEVEAPKRQSQRPKAPPTTQGKSQPPESIEATAAANIDEVDLTSLKAMSVPALSESYTEDQLKSLALRAGIMPDEIEGKGKRQIAKMIQTALK